MYRINDLRVKTIWKTQGELEKAFTFDQDKQFSFCPFTIILGAINSTETGYKPPTSIPNDYTSFSKIFTGREAIQAVWDHSFTLSQPSLPDNPEPAFKNFKVGDIFFGNIVHDDVGITYSASSANNAFIQEQAVKNVILNIPNQPKNFDFINNILSNIYKLYIIPEINATKKTNNTFQVDRQWYYLEVASKTYNQNTKELAFITATFVSLNDKLATSGLAVNQYVQISAPGDTVAFPTLDINKNVILDPNYLIPLPVTHCQITFYGSVMPISIALWGRPIDNNQVNINNNSFQQFASQLLFPWEYQCSTYDPVSFQALPETNYVLGVKTQSVIDSYQDWTQVISPNYDDNAVKHYEGHLKTDVTKTQNTNQVDASGRFVNYWDTNFLNGAMIDDNSYSTAGNPYFQYYNPNNKHFTGNTTYNMNNLVFKGLPNINCAQYFVYNPITEIPLTIRETIKINLNSIPIFGTFFNSFVGGLDIGAKIVSNLLIPQFPYINGLISSELYNFYVNILFSSVSTNPMYIPLDVFRNDTPDTLQAILGSASHMTSFTFNLTDNMNLQTFNYITGDKIGPSTNFTTDYLGQLLGTNVILMKQDNDNSPLLLSPDFTDVNILKWAIDMIDIKVVGKSNFKMTFYSMPDNREGAVSDDFAIWSGIYQTVGKASNNSRLIANTFVLANNTYQFDQPFDFPQSIQPPPLQPRANPIFIDLSNQISYGITNDIICTYPSTNSNIYQMRPNITEDVVNKYSRIFSINWSDYGYNSFANFMTDYESMTFTFSLTMSANVSSADSGGDTNNKSWSTPITISLSSLNETPGRDGGFKVNDITYNSGSTNNDNFNNWIFNLTNTITGAPPLTQTGTLLPTSAVNASYVNNLLWTNDSPTTGHSITSSVWFKITADVKNPTLSTGFIEMRYQFIASLNHFNYLTKSFNSRANWNLQTTSLVINPILMVFSTLEKQVNELITKIEKKKGSG